MEPSEVTSPPKHPYYDAAESSPVWQRIFVLCCVGIIVSLVVWLAVTPGGTDSLVIAFFIPFVLLTAFLTWKVMKKGGMFGRKAMDFCCGFFGVITLSTVVYRAMMAGKIPEALISPALLLTTVIILGAIVFSFLSARRYILLGMLFVPVVIALSFGACALALMGGLINLNL